MSTTQSSNVIAQITSTMTSLPMEAAKSFTFGTIDYIVFSFMLITSIGIGIYFGFFAHAKNTTEEYLRGGKKMKTIPIAISLVASQLSAITVLAIPAENYSFGFGQINMVLCMVFVIPILCHIIIPVFYENNITNCYEYLEMRFNKKTRRIVTATYLINSFLILPVVLFLPSLAFSQVTGFNVHIINTIVSTICVFYTVMGGIKAVVYTDLLQSSLMMLSVLLLGVISIYKVGGLQTVIDRANAGGRLDFSFSWDPRIRVTVWNTLIGGTVMWAGHLGLNQSCVQRIVSLPTIQHAKRSLYLAGFGMILVMGSLSFIGVIMFARYYGCDPILTGEVEKADKLMPYFVQDILGYLQGIPGIFISCIFCTSLSTLSAILNSLSGVVYFDYIKPRINHTEAKANACMKAFVVAMGFYCVLGGVLVQQFKSILQMVITITGINTGAVVGSFTLGMFAPRVNGKVVVTAISLSIVLMVGIIVTGQIKFKSGVMQYDPLPTSTEFCKDKDIAHTLILSNATTTEIPTDIPLVTTAFGSNRDFDLFEMSFYWYKFVGSFIVWLLAIPLSYIWKREEDDKWNPKLYSPLVRKFLRNFPKEMEQVPLKSEISNDVKETILYPEEKTDNTLKH